MTVEDRNGGYAAEAKGGENLFSESSFAVTRSYPCHECGLCFRDLSVLRLHLQRKTAWSNQSLVGCRVSCLVDHREWQEGLVVEYREAAGKHRIVFEHVGESRWLSMLRTAFFIIRRPAAPSPCRSQRSSSSSLAPFDPFLPHSAGSVPESKDVDARERQKDRSAPSLALAQSERVGHWTYVEEISLGYARAQAIMHRAYGNRIQETGHKTRGHLCVTETDRVLAQDAQSSLLYGELLPRGINKALGDMRLRGSEAEVVFELGMGIGKVAMQVFLQFSGQTVTEIETEGAWGEGLEDGDPRRGGRLRRVYGVELSSARFFIAEAAAHRLCREYPRDFGIQAWERGQRIVVEKMGSGAVLEMEVGNLLAVRGLDRADIVLLETDLGAGVHPELCALLRSMKSGARAFTYLDLRSIWGAEGGVEGEVEAGTFPFRQLEINRSVSDRYATSWSVNRGHHFYLWMKVLESGSDVLMVPEGHPEPSEWVPDAWAGAGRERGRGRGRTVGPRGVAIDGQGQHGRVMPSSRSHSQDRRHHASDTVSQDGPLSHSPTFPRNRPLASSPPAFSPCRFPAQEMPRKEAPLRRNQGKGGGGSAHKSVFVTWGKAVRRLVGRGGGGQ